MKSNSDRIYMIGGLLAALIAIVLAWVFLPIREWTDQLDTWIESLGAWGPVIFGLIYIVAVVLLAPASALTLAAGLTFGFWGFPIVVLAATIGASLAFLVSRHLVREKVESMLEDRPRMKAVDTAVSDEGWRIVGLMRLSPVVPFNLQNYFFGVTQVGFVPYAIATFIGIMPGSLLYVYLGTLGKQAASGESSAIKWVFIGAGLLATAVVVWLVTRKAKEKLKEAGVAED